MKGFFKFGCPMFEIIIWEKSVELILDTGFNGHLMLSQILIDELDLEQIGISDYSTATGEEKTTYVYKCKIKFLDNEIEVPVLSTNADYSLAGMDLFHECKIVIERHKDFIEIIKNKENI